MIELRLPIPPSVNASTYNVSGKGRRKSKAYKAWIVQADKWLLEQKRGLGERITGPCVVEFYMPATMRGDVSNRSKCVESRPPETARAIAGRK